MSSIKKHEAQEIRGRILKILNFQYPGALSAQMLNYGLKAARYDCETTLKAHLAYLSEKGYVAVDSVGFADLDLKRDMARLTALGKDLVEGNLPADPGVIVYD
jgi:hypothetical protein